MLKQISFISLVALSFIACKTHKKITSKEKTKTDTVEVKFAATGQDKFKVLQNKVYVKNTVTFNGVGAAFMCGTASDFEKIFGYAEVNAKSLPPIDFSNNRVLGIVGQTTEYSTNYTVKSSYQSAEGYVIRIQENQEANKQSYQMTPFLLLEIPNAYSETKFIVYIDQKQIEVMNQKK